MRKMWRLRFERYPLQLREVGSLAEIGLADVAKQAPGAMLIIFAARLELYGLRGRLSWPDLLTDFPLRVWLDPDPRMPAERSPAERTAILHLQSLLARFPLTAAGLTAMARYLAGQGGLFAQSWPRLAGLEDRSTQQQIEKWLALGAQVPYATWAHFEASRRMLLSAKLPDFRAICFLVQRMALLLGPDFRPVNRGLEFSATQQESLLSWLWHSDARLYKQGYELLDQSLGALPKGVTPEAPSLVYYEWLQQKARIQTGGDPNHAIQYTAPLLGTAAHDAAVEIRALTHALFPPEREPLRLGWRQARLGTHLVASILLGMVVAACAVAPFLLSKSIDSMRALFTPRQVALHYVVHPAPVAQIRCQEQRAATVWRPALLKVPAGKFLMGSPLKEPGRYPDEKQHPVEIPRPFVMFETEVTQSQYKSLLARFPASSERTTKGIACADYDQTQSKPVNCVTWNDAIQYANMLSIVEGLDPCYEVVQKKITWPQGVNCSGYRLPTEAEWEYAARGGTTQIFSGADTPAAVGWYHDNSAPKQDSLERSSSDVRQKQPNAWGFYDLTGNIAEWVWDSYHPYSLKRAGQPEREQGLATKHVIRGGDYFSAGEEVRNARRSWAKAGVREPTLGFRLVRSQ